ncbi:hypothetical protein T484DRAFT_1820015 [Baffinella frigidus]|nr:hypothetical protein T484DRAFT_1820015 [Cryptophyta sp. CCMP2293]
MVFFDLVRSLYEAHHLVFGFLAACNALRDTNAIHPDEWLHFLTNGLGAQRPDDLLDVDGEKVPRVGSGDSVFSAASASSAPERLKTPEV